MYGLALEGGGAKGAFHMGAVKALLEEGYEFGGVAGTSIGALNGAIIVQGDFEFGYQWWEQMDTSMLFDIEKAHVEKYMNMQVSKAMLHFWASLAKDIVGNRGLDTKKIREILSQLIDEQRIRESSMEFGLVTVSVSDWKPVELYKEDIPNGKMIDYLMASANFPAFRIEPLDGKYFIDGGFYDNCPINLLGRKGYKKVVAIRTLGIGRTRKIESNDIEVTNIYPSKDLGKLLVFDNDTIRENLKMGYCDAMRQIRKLKGQTYYIDSACDEDTVLRQLAALPKDEITRLGNALGFEEERPTRMLLEHIVPALAEMIALSADSGYQDIVIGVLEQMAETRGVERYVVYSLGSFIDNIKKAECNLPAVGESAEKSTISAVLAMSRQRKTKILELAGDIFLKHLSF